MVLKSKLLQYSEMLLHIADKEFICSYNTS